MMTRTFSTGYVAHCAESQAIGATECCQSCDGYNITGWANEAESLSTWSDTLFYMVGRLRASSSHLLGDTGTPFFRAIASTSQSQFFTSFWRHRRTFPRSAWLSGSAVGKRLLLHVKSWLKTIEPELLPFNGVTAICDGVNDHKLEVFFPVLIPGALEI